MIGIVAIKAMTSDLATARRAGRRRWTPRGNAGGISLGGRGPGDRFHHQSVRIPQRGWFGWEGEL